MIVSYFRLVRLRGSTSSITNDSYTCMNADHDINQNEI